MVLSLGMKQKLGLIQALMEDPEILVLDEQMNALDQKRKLIVLVSHIKEDIETLCDEIYEINNRTINI